MSTGIERRSIGYSLVAILTIMLMAVGGVATVAPTASALDNGVAVTPPMGWNSWNYFHCNVSEDKIKSAADEIASNGMKEAGYEYIVVDDCWMTDKRDADGVLQSDPKTFPSGMKSLGDYIHSKGLKFGIYQSPTQGTCQKRPGSYGYEELDARTFAEWGVDYLKYDWCQTTPDESPQIWKDNPGLTEKQIAQKLFTRMSEALKKTDRPIVYSLSACCSPLDFHEWAGDVSNLWRTSGDIAPTWRSITANYRSTVGKYAAAGPGRWNDPDMLEVGVRRQAGEGLTEVEARSHFSLWSIMASPLIAGNDLSQATETDIGILTNKDVIAVNQDPLGEQGRIIRTNDDGTEVLRRRLANGDVAVVLFNPTGSTVSMKVDISELGEARGQSHEVKDLWSGESAMVESSIQADVPSHGVAMYTVEM